ncbi:carboxylesterase family protein [Caldilinea sp.]|uniref:carboxylesterase/lipase family protein n=1 Tax=Caldilinea sp. TaxID=2293560 RepID=UPI002CCACD21|nr:carboxylesterase family protein [Anaerolineales bacterium]HQY90500.1 carboxylesterase family protein [Caldilinea sp.]
MTVPVVTAAGKVLGARGDEIGVYSFKGVPFAAPPVGALRWQAPQPVEPWSGVREATHFGPRAMQLPVFGDMNVRSNGMSEDCLYLNVWTPDPSAAARLPVLVYFYGGGFIAGDGSEPRYDGAALARRDIVTVTVNYRLSIFGFFAHPELSAESPHGSSGNYGFLDQNAALRWMRDNIAAFGGDPGRVTIAGESAGSMSVNAQMVSPLSRGLMAGAIGSSGGIGALPPVSLEEAERHWLAFAQKMGAPSLSALRALPAEQLLDATAGMAPHEFPSVVDGWFFPRPPLEMLAAGEQVRAPLMVGWNSEEMPSLALLGEQAPTPANYAAVVQALYGDRADEVLKLYPGVTMEQVEQSATDLAGDRFLVYSTWKWADEHRKTGCPVYRYYYAHPRPPMAPEMGDAVAGLAGGVIRDPDAQAIAMPPAKGAVHSADIEYALGNLATNRVYAWTAEDEQVSALMQGYYANFIKTGDPNGPGLPAWPRVDEGAEVQYMVWDLHPRVESDQHRARYEFHRQFGCD